MAATDEGTDMTDVRTVDEALAVIARDAEDSEKSDADRDAASRLVIAAYEVLRESDWVEEARVLIPIPEKAASRAKQPDSDSRFYRWLAAKLADAGMPAPSRNYAGRLVRATKVVEAAGAKSASGTFSEYALRPLGWLTSHGHGRAVPDVLAEAVQLAGSAEAVTNAHTTQAVKDWKRHTLGAKGVTAAVVTKRAETARIKAQAAIDTLYDQGDAEQWELFTSWMAEKYGDDD